jgi:carbamoyl-phosphate synthase large subunit
VPKRTDLRSILIVGSGPDSASARVRVRLRRRAGLPGAARRGLPVVLANSNPATIMTDPEWADATYLEPLDAPTLAEIVARESPDALLPTLGGQTALNLASSWPRAGAWPSTGRADRRRPARDPHRRGPLALPDGDGRCRAAGAESVVVTSLEQLDECPVPAVVRPAFTLGGRGGGIARTRRSCASASHTASREPDRPGARRALARGLAGVRARGRRRHGRQLHRRLLDREPRPGRRPHRRLVDGRAAADAPDGELQRLRDAAFACARAVGVATAAPTSVRLRAADPRAAADRDEPARLALLRLASKATGFPIAKLAALLAVGYTLDELPNDITGVSSAPSSRRSTTSR